MPGENETVVEELKPEAGGTVVDLTPKPAEQKPSETTRQPGETDPQYLSRLQRLENQVAGNRRINEKLLAEIQSIKSIVTPQPQAPAPAPADGDFWSQVDPRAKPELQKLIQQEAQTLMEKKEQERSLVEMENSRKTVLQNSMEEVYTQYPQLHPDTGSEDDPMAKLYIQAVNQHPEWHHNEYGPVLALREAEKMARQQGVQLNPYQAPSKDNVEVVRRGRVNASSLPPSRPGVSENKVTLTREEREFCDRGKIPYETFAKTKRSLEQGGGVEA